MSNNKKFMFSKSKPALGDAFKHEDVREYLKDVFSELYDAYSLKHFLAVGPENYYKEKIKELSKHFYVLEVDTSTDHLIDQYSYKKVKRCIDGAIFSVGDKVIDKVSLTSRLSPIGRIYEDDRGLHIRLDLSDGTITWRDLSSIEDDLPF